ncbi:unnamed protein product [Candida verbasci]|uniref:Nucleoporin NDC1 n=1 Tax=Candida verbasci TaxID=1227364 RepID=A0A9W4XCP7_9ASCO|nr:unnamed protein product [Candida verbasci]
MNSSSIRNDNYQSIFKKIYNKRLRFVLNINLIISLILPYIYQFPFNSSNTTSFEILSNFLIKTPLIFISLFLIKQVRKKYSNINYSPYKTLSSQIYHILTSKSFFSNWLFYLISSILIYSFYIFNFNFKFQYYLLSKEYRSKSLINDQFIYYWFNCLFLSLFYNFMQLIFQRSRFNFKYGDNRISPQTTLFKSTNLVKIVSQSIGINILVTVLSPIVYYFIKPYFYKFNFILIWLLNLDTTIPKNNTTISTYFKLSYLSYLIILSWEFENHIFNVYSIIGCIDGKKSICSFASDPIACLINGLKNENELVKLTAFQELAYLSTSSDLRASKLRNLLFSQRSKKYNYWNQIYNLCVDEISSVNQRINYRSDSDLKALKSLNIFKDELSNKPIDLFGNSIDSQRKVKSEPIKDYIQPEKAKSSKWISYIHPIQLNIVTNINKSLTIKDFKSQLIKLKYSFLSSNFGILFRITPKKDAESRVLNSVNFGNSIISISNIVKKSIELDKLNITTPYDLSNTLNLLEKVIRTTTNYVDYPPKSIYIENKFQIKHNLIAILHDLSMHEFYEICIIYNFKLNDIILNPRTYKLAKWVIDIAIADQKQKER